MKGLDTNVLIRYLVRDDEQQAQVASSCIHAVIDEGDELFISSIVLCELVWVLESAYGIPKQQIVGALEKLLMTKQFVIQSRDMCRLALDDYRHGRGDFADYLLGKQNQSAGCECTLTFDRSLEGHQGFVIL